MIREPEAFIHPPAPQPMGFRANAAINATVQANQATDRERRRADQLARRCRRLRAVTAMALTATVVGMAAAFALGAIVGYAFGAGLLGVMGR